MEQSIIFVRSVIMKIVPKDAVSYGIDLGKSTFHVVGVDRDGAPIQRIKLNRNNVLQFFTLAKEAKIGMEACPGSQMAGRETSCDRSSGFYSSGAVCQTIRQIEQKRHYRCRGNC